MRRLGWKTCIALGAVVLFVAILAIVRTVYVPSWERDIRNVEVAQIKLFMKRSEVIKLHGYGRDRTEGCFGCENNFIYPKLGVSGRYSETLGNRNRNEPMNQNPQVKEMTTNAADFDLYGIRIGSPAAEAAFILEGKGFKLQEDGSYGKGKYTVNLWTDDSLGWRDKKRAAPGGEDRLGSITINYRVKSDENILY